MQHRLLLIKRLLLLWLAGPLSSFAWGPSFIVWSDKNFLLSSELKDSGLRIKSSFISLIGPIHLIESTSVLQASIIKENLQQLPGVNAVEMNQLITLELDLDPMFSLQWAWENIGQRVPDQSQLPQGPKGETGVDIGMKDSWEITRGSPSVVVAVLDTGINFKHPELQNIFWENKNEIVDNQLDDDGNGFIDDINGVNVYSPRNRPIDGHGHGTHVSGTIAAAHDLIGVMGMAPETKIMVIKAFNDEGTGTTMDILRGIDYAAKMGAQIINASFGSYEKSDITFELLKKLNQRRVMVVAAAGNESQNITWAPHYPAAYTKELDNVLSVAAHTAKGRLGSFSNQSAELVDLAAPGDSILSTFLEKNYQVWSGTSMATPHVAGAIALKLAISPHLLPYEIKQQLLESSIPTVALWHKVKSSGRLNVFNFLTEKKVDHSSVIPLSQWKRFPLKNSWHSPHPYGPHTMIGRTFKIPGASFVRALFSKIETEAELDKVFIRQGEDGPIWETLTGSGENLASVAVAGDSITVELLSDDTKHFYGLELKELLYLD